MAGCGEATRVMADGSTGRTVFDFGCARLGSGSVGDPGFGLESEPVGDAVGARVIAEHLDDVEDVVDPAIGAINDPGMKLADRAVQSLSSGSGGSSTS